MKRKSSNRRISPSFATALIVALTLPGLRTGADDWPQWLGPQRDGVWRETGIVEAFPPDGLPVLWRVAVGSGYSGPAVSDGRVYLTDRHLAPDATNPSNPFSRGRIPGTESVLCLDEQSGVLLWKHTYSCDYTVSYPAGPRATPLVDGNRVYTLGAEGDLRCLDTRDGSLVWRRNFGEDYGVKTPLWGWAAHPLLDGDRLICVVGGEGSTAVAFDKTTGKELWRALTAKEPGYCPPTMIEAAGTRQLILWHPESVNALNPETGEVYWSYPAEIRSALTIPTPRQSGDLLFLTSFYNGSMAFKLDREKPGVELSWQSRKASEKDTEALHSIMPTPIIDDGYIYGVCSYGQLRCLDAGTGERVWMTLEAATTGTPTRWGNAFLVKHEDRTFLFNELGDLILARLTPGGYEEISRQHFLKPTGSAAGRDVLWSHPAFANRRVYARNDEELICIDLSKGASANP